MRRKKRTISICSNHFFCKTPMRVCQICLCYSLFIAVDLFEQVKSSKQRSWLGPISFREGIVPTQRRFHGLVAGGNLLLVFGGYSSTGAAVLPFLNGNSNELMPGAFLNDLQLFDPAKLVWTDITPNALGPPPSPRRSMGFVADDQGMLYVFGGSNDSGKYNFSISICSLHPTFTNLLIKTLHDKLSSPYMTLTKVLISSPHVTRTKVFICTFA